VLATEQLLTKEQMDALRARWDEQSAGFAAGGTTITAGGLKPIALHTNAQESQLAEVLKLSAISISRLCIAFRCRSSVSGRRHSPRQKR
jgi:hypothetical protein